MNNTSASVEADKLTSFLDPFFKALQDPETAQAKVLQSLLAIYVRTGYGREHHADKVQSMQEFQRMFPIANYEDYQPFIQRVMAGETNLLLSEAPIGWAITRGTTKGETKFIPMTPTDLHMRVSAGRAMINYVVSAKQFDLLKGVNLNLNFPSRVGTIKVGEKELEYGYSSGIYTRHVSASMPIRSVPTQDDIDTLGGGKMLRDWQQRFELAYQECKDLDVTLVGGVAPTAIEFARYLHRQHKRYPKDIWRPRIMTLGSVPGINTSLLPLLQALYGQAAIREIYGATEGMFGQQMDEKSAWIPNYDLYLFEVMTQRGLKMLHQMQPGELGSLVVSTSVLPRYEIGDTILAVNPPYYRCIGRQQWWTPIRYAWSEFTSFNFGRL